MSVAPGILSCLAVYAGQPAVPSERRECDSCGEQVWVSLPWVARLAEDPSIAPCCERCAQLRIRRLRDSGEIAQVIPPSEQEKELLAEQLPGIDIDRLAKQYARRLLFGPTIH